MLHTPSSSESIPLFSTAVPTSLPMSCGTEDRLTIQRPACDSMSFDWSDLLVVQNQNMFEDFPMQSRHAAINDFSSASGPISRDDLSSSTSFDSLHSTYSCSSDSTVSSTSSTGSRKVSFSDNIKVRTHSIVLGDHPCCNSLALELGWEYDESELALSEKRTKGTAVRRRPYLERKDILKRVSGMTDAEIKQIVTSKLRSVAPSSSSLSALASC